MKPLTLAILLVPCVVLAAHLKGFKGVRAGADSGGTYACTTSQVTDGESYNTASEFLNHRWLACPFTTGGSGFNACSVSIRLDHVLRLSGDIDVAIYSDSSSAPGSIVGSFSPTMASSIINFNNFYIFYPSATLSSSTTYWLVVRASTVDVEVIVAIDTVGESGKNVKHSTDGTSWSNNSVDSVFNFTIYSQ